MKVLIVGYGRMGHEVESALLQRGHQVVARIDRSPGLGDATELSSELLRSADAAIEFSLPEGVVDNIRSYAQAGVPAVIGTTGWEAHREEARAVVEGNKASLVYGSNFSLGAHLFFRLVGQAAAMIQELPEYDILLTEWHHKLKKDSPSGTALTTASRILASLPRKTSLVTDRLDRAIEPHELHVASVRGGSIPGIHQVLLDSVADTVEITHTARSRSGFALGAVLAAEWLTSTRKTGFLSVDEFAQEFFAATTPGRQA
ncbi:MAG: 4-hydroxy-tetrahydrodipicolinate reductase [Spirochaetales bacterium]